MSSRNVIGTLAREFFVIASLDGTHLQTTSIDSPITAELFIPLRDSRRLVGFRSTPLGAQIVEIWRIVK